MEQAEVIKWLDRLRQYATGERRWNTASDDWVCEKHPLMPGSSTEYSFKCLCGAMEMPPFTPEPQEGITGLKYDADIIKPEIHKTVIVHGGCAFWDGVNWRTRMDADNGIIAWKVKYWCDIPDL
jgi:hypothetical protein